MKATASPISDSGPVEKTLIAVVCDLVKARLTFLVLLTTLVGYYVGARGAMDYLRMLHTLLGTALLACGAAALNQLWERDHDALMRRTADRPLPSGRLQPDTVLVFGGVLSISGLIYLSLAVNLLTSLLGAVTLASYVWIYTPLKRVTWLNTAVGAIPGALPPLMGWTAARNELTGEGWALFAILFFWQIPHFLAIAWMYRDEYEKAGFVMLPSVDPGGFRTGRQPVSGRITSRRPKPTIECRQSSTGQSDGSVLPSMTSSTAVTACSIDSLKLCSRRWNWCCSSTRRQTSPATKTAMKPSPSASSTTP
jgi:protoheme IX farnesyltransferase